MSDQSKYTVVDLATLAINHRVVPVNEKEAVLVYGLPFSDMMQLFASYTEYLDEMLDPAGSFIKTADIVSRMMTEAPELIGRIICNATRTEINLNSLSWAASLPAGVQAIIITESLALTFPGGDLMGKFWGKLEDLVKLFSSQLALKIATLKETQVRDRLDQD